MNDNPIRTSSQIIEEAIPGASPDEILMLLRQVATALDESYALTIQRNATVRKLIADVVRQQQEFIGLSSLLSTIARELSNHGRPPAIFDATKIANAISTAVSTLKEAAVAAKNFNLEIPNACDFPLQSEINDHIGARR